METEYKEVVKEKVYENTDSDRTERKARNGFGMGLAGVLTGGVALLSQFGMGRGLFGGASANGATLPENVNINANLTTPSSTPTAFEAYAKGCEETLALTNEIWGMKLNTQNEFYANRNTDIAEKFSLWKGQIDADFAIYKGYRDMGDAISAQIQSATFGLYKGQRDSFDCLAARIASLEKDVAINAAVRPYQDKLIQCEIDKAYTAGINYTNQRTCKAIYGEVVLPSTPTVTGYGSYSPCAASTATASSVTA